MDETLAKMIDHTLLKPEATTADIQKLCEEAKKYHFASVCVNPSFVSFAHEQLKDTDVRVCTVIGFPLGATPVEVKGFETKLAIEQGATEVDMVINIGALKEANDQLVKQEIEEVVHAAKGKALTKVIIETCLLTNDEKIRACQLAKEAGADYVKTSTGFSLSGANVEDIRLMRQTVGEKMGVKASGGVRDRKSALAMIKAGATRIGASSSIKIVEEQ